MELLCIFVDEETGEGLYSILYGREEKDEYERLFDNWADASYVLEYLKQNQKYLAADYFAGADIEDIASKIDKESEELENAIENHFFDSDKTLQMLFLPIGKQYLLPLHQKTKALVNDRRYFPRPVLRIYGIRISDNSFVITGGAIKLVHSMMDHPDTEKELQKLEIARAFLVTNGFNTSKDLQIII